MKDKTLEKDHIQNALSVCGYPDWLFHVYLVNLGIMRDHIKSVDVKMGQYAGVRLVYHTSKVCLRL